MPNGSHLIISRQNDREKSQLNLYNDRQDEIYEQKVNAPLLKAAEMNFLLRDAPRLSKGWFLYLVPATENIELHARWLVKNLKGLAEKF